MIEINSSNIPEELKSEHFMLWRLEQREGRLTKPPINPSSGFKGNVQDPKQWTDFANALRIHTGGRFHTSGISVVVHPSSGLVGLDLDHCINEGTFSDEAKEILSKVSSYSEISPSGKGVRIFLYGKLPGKGRRKGNFECYDEGRHLTVTGNHIPDTPKVINRDQGVIDWFHQKFIATVKDEDSSQGRVRETTGENEMVPAEPASDVSKLQVNEIIQQIRSSRQKDKFERLYEGNTAGYSSPSEADLALCSILSFWTGRNFKLIDSIFRQSSLYRSKWDEKHYSDGRTYGQETITRATELCTEVYNPLVSPDIKEIKDFLNNQERGDAELLASLFHQEFLYDHIAQCWLWYENGVWNQDQEKQTLRIAVEELTKVYLDASSKTDQEITQLISEKNEANQERIAQLEALRDRLRGRVNKLNNRNRISNVLKMAESWLPTATWKFDRDPLKLNLANGIYDLNAKKLLEHSHEHLCLKQAPVTFDKDAPAPHWDEFLNTIFGGDQELIHFVKQAVGFSLSGLCDLQALIFCYGSGANGKSTFFGVLRELLGDYYQGIQVETFLSKAFQSSSEPYELARVKGARMVVSDEVPEGRKLNESLVKNLTGGDQIHARNPYEKPFSFNPTHTLWMFGNHKPVISGMDHGIWRRIYLIPFTVTISEEQKRPQEELMKEFKGELSGILNWALEGWSDYRRNGLQIPAAVKNATSEYKSESDTMAAFISEKCVKNTVAKVHTTKLFQSFKEWAKENNEYEQIRSSRAMIALLRDRGFDVLAGSQNKHYVHGLGLEAEENETWVN
jgi:putative DNA primase/helicase